MSRKSSGNRKPTPMQERYIEGMEMGLLPNQAAKRAGFAHPAQDVQRLKKVPWVAERLEEIAVNRREELGMTREKVEAGVMEAIEMARVNGDPQSMIRGWSEINRMCGFYAPEQKELKLSTSATQTKREIESMDEKKLLELAGEEAIEGEFEEVNEEEDG